MLTANLFAIVLMTSGLAAPGERPPKLTFDKHVDYIGWWRQEFANGSGENAYERYRLLIPDADFKGGFPKLEGAAKEEYDRRKTVWEPKDNPALDAYLKACEPFCKDIEKATLVKAYWQPLPDDLARLIEIQLPELAGLRDASRALGARAWRKQDHQDEAIIEAVRTLMGMSAHVQQHPVILGSLVGRATRNISYSYIVASLDDGVISGDKIVSAYNMLRDADPGPFDVRRTLMADWAIALDTLQSVCKDGQVQLDQLKAIGADRTFSAHEANFVLEWHFESLADLASGPITGKTAKRIDEHFVALKNKVTGYDFTRCLCSDWRRVYGLALQTESYRCGTMIALALYAHHAKHGKWPDRLRDTDKDVGLKDYRRYGKDPYTGKLFKYKLVDGNPVLYSIGADGKDDGGRHDANWGEKDGGDFVFIPCQK